MPDVPKPSPPARFAMPDEQWQKLKSDFALTDRDIVDLFMRPFLLEVSQTKAIQFATDPRHLPERSLTGEQWRILRDDHGFIFDETTGRAVHGTREHIEELL